MSVARQQSASSALSQGGLLLTAGGFNSNGTLASAELYGFATVKTDASDYAPGSVVTISGTGWQPGETVTLTLVESPLVDTHPVLTAVADGQGNIINAQFSPDDHDVDIRFYLTAVGSQSGYQAQNTFTDGNATSVSGSVRSSAAGNPAISGATITCTGGCNNVPAATTTSGVTGAYVFSSATTKLAFNTNGPVTISLTASATGFNSSTISFTVNNGDTLTGKDFTLTPSVIVTTTTVGSSLNPSAFGQSVTFVADVHANTGSSAPAGTVQFVVDGVNSGAAVALAPCTPPVATAACASLSIATLTVNGSPHSVVANYAHTGTFADSTGSLSGGQSVGKATPTITWTSPADITYGTPLSATQLNATASVPGTFNYNPASGTVLNAGNPQTLHVDFTPTDSANYTTASKDVQINVNRKNAAWTTNPNSKTYGDPDPSPVTTGSGSGFLAADNVTGTYARAAGETVTGGPYHITATLSPVAALNNYNITNSGADFTITTRAATWTTNPASKTYGDADPNPLTTGSGTNFIAGDNVTAIYSRTAGETVLGGPYHIIATLAPAGVLSNYSVTNAGASFTVNTRPAIWTTNANSKTYGDADPNPLTTGSGTNFIAGDNVTATYSRTAGETVLGGPYHITATLSPSAVLSNYIVTNNGADFTVNKRLATWPTNPASKIYGDADPIPLTTGSGSNFVDPVTASYSRSTGETVAGSPYHITATLNAAAGVLDNYIVTNNGADFTINRRLASWTTIPTSKTYGDADPSPLTTGSGSNFVDPVTASYSRSAGETVAGCPYHINATLNAVAGVLDNYIVTNNGADFTINKRLATWTTNQASKTYGDPDPSPLTTGSASNFVDPVTASYSRSTGEIAAGSPYHITAMLNAAAGVLDNYTVTNNGADFIINKRLATWTTIPASKTYGDPDPTPLTTGSGTNFLPADGVTATYSRAAGETVPSGPYQITATLSPSAALTNYVITNVGANFTISSRAATWTTIPASKNYGDSDPSPLTTGSGSNFVASDGVTATYSRASGETVQSGGYHITSTLSPASVLANYSITNAGAAFTINPDNTSLSTVGALANYGDAAVTLHATVMNTTNSAAINEGIVTFSVKQGASLIGTVMSGTVSSGMALASFPLGSSVDAGTYTITASFGPSTDFNQSGTTAISAGSLVVNQDTTSVSPANANATYGAASVTLTGTVSNSTNSTPVNGGTVTFTVRDALNNFVGSATSGMVSAGMASAPFTLGSGVNAGSYAVSATYSGSTDFKSSTSTASAALTITRATSTVSVGSSLNPSTLNQPVTFTATVSPQISGTPTGTVTFVDTTTNTNVGTGTSIGSGKWTLTTSAIPVNANLITATYGGDTNFTGNSGSITQTVRYVSGGICDGDAGHQILQPINADGTSVFNGKST